MSYRQQRDYENLNKAIFDGVGKYDIPVIEPDSPQVDNWISFNYAKGCEEPEIHGIHFFIDDYQFVRVWKQPDTYLDMLRKFQAVCTPDFSTYTDFPKTIQLYNHYRKHWLGAYWQMNGIRVIPTISWAEHRATASGQGEMNYIMRRTAKADSQGLRNQINKDFPRIDKKWQDVYKKAYDEEIKKGTPRAQALHIARQKGVGVLNAYYKRTFPKFGFEYITRKSEYKYNR